MFAVNKSQKRALPAQEENLLNKIREGNGAAYEKVFRLYYSDLSRYAFSILKKSDEAEDLVQQVFVNFWEKREQTIITGALKSYLYRSVHNACLNVIKHEKVKAQYLQHSTYFDNKFNFEVEENYLGDELSSKIEAAIDELPTQCGRIFRLNRMESLKYKEIAEHLDISVKTVENQIGKALKLLRGSLAEYLISILFLIFRI